MKKLKIVERKISELIEAEYNPRQLTNDQYQHLKDSLVRFGFVDPVIVNMHPDRKNVIIGGHQRFKIWRDMEQTIVPTVELSLTVDEEKELNIRLNKNVGEWDFEALANYFDVDQLLDFGFQPYELDQIEMDIDDVENVGEIKLGVNYLIQCANVEELQKVQKYFGVDGQKMNATAFFEKVNK